MCWRGLHTGVTEVVTLLVKSWRSIFYVMGAHTTRGMYLVFPAFKSHMEDRLSAHF
jgi:hypothetical protein